MNVKKLKQEAEKALEKKGTDAEVMLDAKAILQLAEMCQRMEAILHSLATYQWPLHHNVRETLNDWNDWKKQND